MLVDVFIDRACWLVGEPPLRRLGAIPLDISDSKTLERLAGGGILLIGTSTSNDAAVLPSVRAVRAAHPHVVIVLCAKWREASRVPLSRWFRAGVDEFLTFGDPPDVTELALVVERHGMAPPPAEELKLLRSTMPASWVLEAVMYMLRNACCEMRASELAHRFGYSARAFRDFLSKTGYPRPGDVCRLGRFLRMAELIGLGITAPRDLARRLGFTGPTDMRKARSRMRQSMASESVLPRFASGFPRMLRLLGLYRQ